MEAWREELYHYGIKGQKWGTRHWQNPDGTFNAAGKERYFGKGSGENYHPVKQTKSLKGNMHRLAAKNYALNEKTYAKSNPTLSSMNKAAKEEALKKAAAADKAKADRQANRKQLTQEQKKKIATAAVATLATAAVVGGTIYLAKTGKLDSVAAKGKDLVSKGKAAIKDDAKYAGYALDIAKRDASIAADKIKNKVSGEAAYTKYKVDKAINNGKNAADRLISKVTYKKRMREAEEADRVAEKRQRMLEEYARQSLEAFKDPNVLSYTRNDDSIGYHEHWDKATKKQEIDTTRY